MILRQFLHTNPVAVSYLFGCGGKAAGAVVDPVGEIGPYLRAAQDTGMRILYVIDTHIHADHLSAGPELARAVDAPYVLFADADAVLPFKGVHEGDVLELVFRANLGERRDVAPDVPEAGPRPTFLETRERTSEPPGRRWCWSFLGLWRAAAAHNRTRSKTEQAGRGKTWAAHTRSEGAPRSAPIFRLTS